MEISAADWRVSGLAGWAGWRVGRAGRAGGRGKASGADGMEKTEALIEQHRSCRDDPLKAHESSHGKWPESWLCCDAVMDVLITNPTRSQLSVKGARPEKSQTYL